MAHARKESLGTAASLFGDTSGDTDFFSSLQQAPVADDNAHRQLSQPTDSAPDLATSSSQSQDDAAGLFGSTEGASAWDQSLYEASADQHQMAAGASYDYGAGAGQADATQDAYASQGWYDDDGQWHYYSEVDSQNWPSTAAAQDTTYASAGQGGQSSYDYSTTSSYDYSAPTSTYTTASSAAPATNAYAPSTSAYEPLHQQQQTQHPYQPQTSSYSSYAPAQNAYAPTATTSSYTTNTATTAATPARSSTSYAPQTSSSYDPYKPTASNVYAPPTTTKTTIPPPINTTYPSYNTTPLAASTPKPTQHAADVYKATTYNAYDPPILDRPRKGAKAQNHLTAGMLSPPPSAGGAYPGYSQSLYGVQAQPAQPTVVPPPPKSPYAGQIRPPPSRTPQQSLPPPPLTQNRSTTPAYDPYSVTAPHLQPNGHGHYAPPPPAVKPPPPMPPAHHQPQTGPYQQSLPNGATYGGSVYQNGFDHGVDGVEGFGQGGYDPEGGESAQYDPYRADGGGEFVLQDEIQESGGGNDYLDHAADMAPSETAVPSRALSPPTAPAPPSRPTSVASSRSYGIPPPAHYGQPKEATVSPPSSMKGSAANGSLPPSPVDRYTAARVSPPTRYQSPPSKALPPSRSATPGSIKSLVTSPDHVARMSTVSNSTGIGARASPRPESYQSQSSSSGASNPAAHLEMARNKIVSPPSAVNDLPSKPPSKVNGTSATYDPYRPAFGPSQRSASMPLSPTEPPKSVSHPYAPLDVGIPRVGSPYGVDRAAAVELPSSPAVSYSPYAPPPAPGRRRQASEPTADFAGHPADPPTQYGHQAYGTEPPYSTRQSLESNHHAAYIPSTTQTGGDDLLARKSSKAPLVCFGFGGKFVSCFPNTTDTTAGFDVSMISRKPPSVHIRPLKNLVPEWENVAFPGPLFCDPGAPTVNIAKTASATLKAKKGLVIKYLEDRAKEVEEGLGHLPPEDRSKASGKLCMLQLLRVMVENDGKLSGSPEIEKAIRHILVPRLKEAGDVAYGFTSPAANSLLVPGAGGATAYGALSHDAPLATYEVRASVLDKIQEYLIMGERRMAYRYALDERLWAHAMLIASSVDKDAWKESVSEFIRTELATDAMGGTVPGREPLRMAYGMFAGEGYSAVEGLVPPRSLVRNGGSASSLLVPPSPIPPSTPVMGQQPLSSFASDVPVETLCKWQETAATAISNATNGDVAPLTGLGDMLMANHWEESAHVCYLLSLQTSLLGGIGTPNAKVTLLGSQSPQTLPYFQANTDAFIFTEILEFALSLTPVAKGQDTFGGVAHLQPYRLIRAAQLAETGHVSLALRYCEAVGTSLRLSKHTPYFTPTFQEQLKELTDRLNGTPHMDKSGSWIARKMTKPSLAGLGTWIESGVTNFIAGSGDDAAQAEADTKKRINTDAAAGPFAQFSVISSANTSPNASSANLSAPFVSSSAPAAGLVPPPTGGPRRTGSALAFRGSVNGLSPIDRSASAMDMRPENKLPYSPGPQVFSANPATTSFYQAQSMYGAFGSAPEDANRSSLDSSRPANGNWWDAGISTAATSVEEETKSDPSPQFYSAENTSNFASPMDSLGPSQAPSYAGTPRTGSVAPVEEEDLEDLGFGNASHKKKKPEPVPEGTETGDTSSKTPEPTPAPAKAEPPSKPAAAEKPAASGSGSWLPWKWGAKKEETGTNVVKAKLGEENAFYYDETLKKWVNKKAKEDANAAPAALPPPPSRTPSRAQTASPVGSTSTMPSPLSRGATPPPRPASSVSAPPSVMKAAAPPRRSHLAESFVPTPDTPSAPSTPSMPVSAGLPPAVASRINDPDLMPPPSRTGSAAAKRKGKSRYVDVFNQPS